MVKGCNSKHGHQHIGQTTFKNGYLWVLELMEVSSTWGALSPRSNLHAIKQYPSIQGLVLNCLGTWKIAF